MHYRKTILASALLGTLVVGILTSEAKRPTGPPPTLTTAETICQTVAAGAYASAQARDNGVPYLKMVATMRGIHTSTDPLLVLVRDATLNTLRLVYQSPELPPVAIRNLTEIVCVEEMEKALAKHGTQR